jgi:hypothetical protein
MTNVIQSVKQSLKVPYFVGLDMFYEVVRI